MKLKLIYLMFLPLAAVLSCSDSDEPTLINEEEVITTLRVTLTPQGGGTAVVLQSQDLDGDGPNAPVITVSGNLAANSMYTGTVEVLNELESPIEDITEEVEEEAEEHQFFYTPNNAIVAVQYTDMDANGNPIGITFNLQTGGANTDTLTVTLRHEPNKYAVGVADGDITNADGETDVEAVFTITVQ